MKVNLKCFSTLVNPEACEYRNSTAYDLADGQTVENLAQRAGIEREDVKIVFLNGRIADLDAVLSNGDRIALAPAIGGM